MPSDVNIMEIHTDFKELLELFSVRSPKNNNRKADISKISGQYDQTLVCFC
jgi:hypothetical protein